MGTYVIALPEGTSLAIHGVALRFLRRGIALARF
jgi:hypothetical protein